MNNYQLAMEQEVIENFEFHLLNSKKGSSKSTVKGYMMDIRVFLRYLDGKDIEYTKVTPMMADRYIAGLRGQKAYATIDRYLVSLNRFYSYLHKKARLIEYNPFKDVERVEPTKVEESNKEEKEILTHEELLRIEEVIKEEIKLSKKLKGKREYKKNPIRDHAMMLIMMSTGCRIGEVCGLTFNDINLENRIVIFRDTKNGLTISRDISQKAVAAIKLYISRRENSIAKDDTIFINRKGTQVKSGDFNKEFAYYIEKAGIQKELTSHRLRATFATLYHEQCGDIEMVRDALNHQSIDTTKRYIKGNEYKKNVKTGFSLV